MIEAAKLHKHAVVIGGGLLGLEAANGLKLRGMDVTVVHLGPWLLERQLDEIAGKMLQKSLEDKGLKFLLQKQTEADSGRIRPRCGNPLQGRHADSGRPRRHGRRYPPELRAGRILRHLLQPRHCGERHDADLRPEGVRRRRVRQPPRHCLRPGRAALRAGQGRRQPSGRLRHRPLYRLGDLDQAQSHRHRPVLGR
jgi:hypothetical protein